MAMHVRHRDQVNGQWGFGAKHPRGLGLTALFAGTSGTGKSMAAEVIAGELGLDLYRIDLATVVSKYIGETEKNLHAIFAAATHSGAILLFDEADALFGKRSEVRDSHDRYANLEVSYLLQQMEAYQGVAILTTNMQHALDPAFLRRLRFVVQFPFPDAPARERIWRGVFPAATPVADLDFNALARLNVSGGVIRNIAVLAAFLAAGDGGRVRAGHILAAVRTEYAKLDKPLTAAETRGLA
jgi:SpoVK/Ycf46/Vps4 family AAA+-type ATPase